MHIRKPLFMLIQSNVSINTMTSVAPLTQGTWRSNDYVSAFRLVDIRWFHGGVGRAVYIHIG